MLETLTNSLRPIPSPQGCSTDPLSVESYRPRESPLARVLLALLSVALLICSLTAPHFGWLGWVALVPLMLTCEGLKPLHAAGIGFVTAIVASFGIYGWLFEVPDR
ncbi:MAG: hypothetical protein ACREIM_00075 [Nitrospiraceae bacterium]